MSFLILSLLVVSADSTSVEGFYKAFIPYAGKGLISGVFSSANTRGKFPHIGIGIGASSSPVSISKVYNPVDANQPITGSFPTLTLRLDIGISPGIKFAPMVGGFGSIDILYRRGILLLPHINVLHKISDNFYFNTYGFRFGFLRDSRITPAISLNYRYSSTQLNFNFGTSTEPDSGHIFLKTQSLFLSISKRFVAINPYIGVGVDFVSGTGEYSKFNNSVRKSENAPKIFGGIQLSLPVLNFNFEGGNTLSGKYFGLAVRLLF